MNSFVRRFSILTLLTGSSASVLGQSTTLNSSYSDSTEPIREVHYNESSTITKLMDSYAEYHKKHTQIDGYRIEIFSSSGANSKLKARNTRLKFQSSQDSIPAYVVWEYPNFEVRVGDYRTKLEAEAALEEIIQEFPFAFITKDKIELPALVAKKPE